MALSGYKLAFGPSGDQWIYDPWSRTYDLTHSSSNPASEARGGKDPRKTFTVRTSHGPPNVNITISPSQTALVVVDMQNFFLSPRCRVNPNGLAAVGPTIKMVEKCRALGVKIIWLNWGLSDVDLISMPAGISRAFARSIIESATNPSSSSPAPASSPTPTRAGLGGDLGSDMGRCLMWNTWNAELYPALAAKVDTRTDVHCTKNRMSGLWSTDTPLFKYLKGEGSYLKTLMFAGVNTDQCVLGTLSDAYSHGWDCVMVDDCCGTGTEWGREVCLANAAGSYGFVITSETFVEGILQ